jgi:hypothetical protein
MKGTNLFFLIALITLLLQTETNAQTKVSPHFNAGYITSIGECEDCTKVDEGGSVRIGLLTSGRLGYYAGYIWFKKHFDRTRVDYDDEGSGIVAGVDFLLNKEGEVKWYLKGGLFFENLKSTYDSGKTENQFSPKPDFGLFVHYKFFNVLLAWQPSDPSLINLGAGLTLQF